MYTEASAPRKTGDKAMLISQLFNPTSSTTGKCLRFYRHMLGPHIGTLNVKIRQEGKDSLIWSDSGNQGDVWIPSQAPVYSKTPYRVSHYIITSSLNLRNSKDLVLKMNLK